MYYRQCRSSLGANMFDAVPTFTVTGTLQVAEIKQFRCIGITYLFFLGVIDVFPLGATFLRSFGEHSILVFKQKT